MAYDFDTIARTYDRLNRIMTLGLDRRWRKRAVKELSTFNSQLSTLLDVACGTGDMVVELMKHGCTVTGIDLSEEMLAIARQKTAVASCSPKLGELSAMLTEECVTQSSINVSRTPAIFQLGNAEALPFADGEFDAVTCAFGVRNFVHRDKALQEFARVLKPGGKLLILELSTPKNPLLLWLWKRYALGVIPLVGGLISGKREAYRYLPESILRFPAPEHFFSELQDAGFRRVEIKSYTWGVCRAFLTQKRG